MGLITTTKVVTRADMYGQHEVIQPGNRERVTSIEYVSILWDMIIKGHEMALMKLLLHMKGFGNCKLHM